MIADFGYAAFKAAGKASMSQGRNKGCGTDAFKAPELFEEDEDGAPTTGPSFAADVYAFAATAWCLLTGVPLPYPEMDASGKPIFPSKRVPKGLRPGTSLAPPFEYDASASGVPAALVAAYPEILGILRECLCVPAGLAVAPVPGRARPPPTLTLPSLTARPRAATKTPCSGPPCACYLTACSSSGCPRARRPRTFPACSQR